MKGKKKWHGNSLVKQVNFRLPSSKLRRFDQRIKALGYDNRQDWLEEQVEHTLRKGKSEA